jgi:hypothetical protein
VEVADHELFDAPQPENATVTMSVSKFRATMDAPFL